jgi:cytidine deaminase
MTEYRNLIELAKTASKNAYSPYSKFSVGACVLTDSGKTFLGCNFENSSYGLSICAERNAIGSAIVAGEKKIKAIAIYSPNMENCTPCGACRQVIHEFQVDGGADVITELNGELIVHNINELLPGGFSL